MSNIILKQLPVIIHTLQEVGEKVTERIEALNLDNEVATEETVKSLKKLRAELTKEANVFEGERKDVKSKIIEPYSEFETVYNTEIKDKYKTAVALLKTKIDAVETKIKDTKKANLIEYFDELCASENIDFVPFEKVGLKIDLSTTEKKLKEQCNEYILKVASELELIEMQEHKIEILAEYKQSLNVSASIKMIVDRKERERIEKARIEMEAWGKRKRALLDLSVIYHETTNTFEFNENIYVNADACRAANDEEFAKIVEDLRAEIVKFNESKAPVKETVKAAPISAPKVESKPERIETARFECKAPLAKLKALGQYMKDNGIIYTNIKNK